MLVRGFSKALFSTWFYLPEIRSVFDAGEGINFALAGRLVRAESVFLTHGHTDHFTGLLNLLIARDRLSSGEEPPAPLHVFFPGADANLRLYLDYVQQHLKANGFPEIAHFQAVAPGDRMPLPGLRRHFVQVFPVRHGPLPAVGYCLFETRDKVRAEFVGLSPEEISRSIQEKGREAILVPVDSPVACYPGDSEGSIDAPCRKPRLLFHEATFLSESDRGESDHATLSEALESARRIQPSELILFHFSMRYRIEEIRSELGRQLGELPLPDCQVFCAFPGRAFIYPTGVEDP